MCVFVWWWWCCDKVCTVGHLLHHCRFVLNILQVDCVNSQQSTFVTALWMPNQLEDESVRIVQFPTRVREVKFIALSACAISLSPGGGGVPLCVVGQICVLNKHDTQQKTHGLSTYARTFARRGQSGRSVGHTDERTCRARAECVIQRGLCVRHLNADNYKAKNKRQMGTKTASNLPANM